MQRGFAHAKTQALSVDIPGKQQAALKGQTQHECSDYTQAGSFVPTIAVLSPLGVVRSAHESS